MNAGGVVRDFVGAVRKRTPVSQVNERDIWLLISGSQVRALCDPPLNSLSNLEHYASECRRNVVETTSDDVAVFCRNLSKSIPAIRREFVGGKRSDRARIAGIQLTQDSAPRSSGRQAHRRAA